MIGRYLAAPMPQGLRRGKPSGFSGPADRDLLVGIGDDATVLRPRPGVYWSVTCDALNQGVHFFDWEGPRAVASKVFRSNLSDLAAMGAEPKFFWVCASLERLSEDWLDGFFGETSAILRRYGGVLVGGDTTRGPTSFAVTALGESREPPLLRSTAKPGDDIWVTGTLGRAKAALQCHFAADFSQASRERGRDLAPALLQALRRARGRNQNEPERALGAKAPAWFANGLTAPPSRRFDAWAGERAAGALGAPLFNDARFLSGKGFDSFERWFRRCEKKRVEPTPRFREVAALRPALSAGLDVSDGFAQDLGHILERSGVAATVRLSAIPLDKDSDAFWGEGAALRWALFGGDDYELILCAPRSRRGWIEKKAKKEGLKIARVGKIEPVKSFSKRFGFGSRGGAEAAEAGAGAQAKARAGDSTERGKKEKRRGAPPSGARRIAFLDEDGARRFFDEPFGFDHFRP